MVKSARAICESHHQPLHDGTRTIHSFGAVARQKVAQAAVVKAVAARVSYRVAFDRTRTYAMAARESSMMQREKHFSARSYSLHPSVSACVREAMSE